MIQLDTRVMDFALGDFSKSLYVQRANELVPVLRQRARKQWSANRLLDETAELIHEYELFRMLQPRRFGGGETSPMEWLETISTLAEGDASVAWVTGVLGILHGISAYSGYCWAEECEKATRAHNRWQRMTPQMKKKFEEQWRKGSKSVK